jgi:hypothetical protein
MKKLILLLIFTSLLNSCSSDSNNSSNSNNSINSTCQSQDFITKFNSIPDNASYNDIKSIFGGVEGDNYRNDQYGASSVIKFYKWYPCNDNSYYVDCWIIDNTQLVLRTRTIYDFSICSNSISSTNFSSLTNGMTYNQVKNILNCDGDLVRVDSNNSAITKFYRFYNCNDTSKYVEAWFTNNAASLIFKNF